MYDSPDIRDSHRAAHRIEQLEAKLRDLERKLDVVGPNVINLVESVKRLATVYDALSKGVEFLFDRSGASIEEFCLHRKRFDDVQKQPGPCECFACRAERHDKQHGSGKPAADPGSDPLAEAVGNAIASALQHLLGPTGHSVEFVEAVSGEYLDEFMRRAQADGVRAAREWLGLQMLKRGAKGHGEDRPEGRE